MAARREGFMGSTPATMLGLMLLPFTALAQSPGSPVVAASSRDTVPAVSARHTVFQGNAVRGVNQGSLNEGTLGGPTAGVHGSSPAGRVGVMGESNGGVGVHGTVKGNRGAGVLATAEGIGGTALQINNGAIRVGGGGIASRNKPLFIHQATKGKARTA